MTLAERFAQMPVLRFFSALVPVTCGMLAVLLANLPVPLFGGLVPTPLLGLVPVYFWCLVRPDLMTPAVTLVIGLLEDVVSGGPPGVWTLSFVLTYALVARQRDSFAGLSGLVAVLGFAAAAAFACACAWLTVAALHGRPPLFAPIFSELAMTVLFYVPATFVIGIIHRHLVGPLRSDF